MDSETKANLSTRSTWMRLVYMIIFLVVFNITEIVLAVVVVIQFLFKLFSGQANARLKELGQALAAYIYEIILFLTFHSEDMPYPFAPWPKGAPGAKAAAASPPAKAKRARRSRNRTTQKPEPEAGE